jgi:hypothetical protein
MRAFEIEIAGKIYKGSTASAKNQFEALHIAGFAGLIIALKDNVSDMAVVSQLLVMPFNDVQRIVDLLVKDLLFCADKVPVAENLFADNIQDYYLLIAKTAKENLGNFWQLCRPEKPDNQAAEQK